MNEFGRSVGRWGEHMEMNAVLRRHDPVVLPATTSVQQACATMRHHRTGCVLVTDAIGHLCGIFTARDAVFRVLAIEKDAARTLLAEVMIPDPATMLPTDTNAEALRLMRAGGFRHVPVTSGGHVIGITSWGDCGTGDH